MNISDVHEKRESLHEIPKIIISLIDFFSSLYANTNKTARKRQVKALDDDEL